MGLELIIKLSKNKLVLYTDSKVRRNLLNLLAWSYLSNCSYDGSFYINGESLITMRNKQGKKRSNAKFAF